MKATEVLPLWKNHGNVVSTLDVLAADLLIDDRVSKVEQYFTTKTSGLPDTILA